MMRAWIAKHKETGEYDTSTFTLMSRKRCEMLVIMVFEYEKRIAQFKIVELELTEVENEE